jgi:hypothetical protein
LSDGLTDGQRELFRRITEGGENIDLVPGDYNGVHVALVVEWLTDDNGDPTYDYEPLAVLATPEFLGAIKHPELSPLTA